MPYSVMYHEDDTIRVAMIGDSWAALHLSNKMDSFLQCRLSNQIGIPIKMTSKGKGGFFRNKRSRFKTNIDITI